jgi:hypothetical protein
VNVEHPRVSSLAEPPRYFDDIRERASKRWDQLEADPELAGPWHQLFKQVQSPRHILSELLQNADDAGATTARVRIDNDRFVFEHDGDDFIESHFASICRFGYSNKRGLHTIGFRGIGFKSTFSLGDRVELFTPSLAVRFDRERFTQPHWIDCKALTDGPTRVEVAIATSQRRLEVEKNLEEWLKSPVSLLFFKNIRRLQIGDETMHWQSMGDGPVPGSDWMALDDDDANPFLLIRSGDEAFPADALEEIRQERLLGPEESGEFPPCRVEIVLGAKGRLYVVLPTGVETALPFACNAPFIQDPARLKIKDPAISPTNRWLLERAGHLAAKSMMEWLGETQIGLLDRSSAYGLLPDVDREASDLEGLCAAAVEIAFDEAIGERPILLTDDGRLVANKAAVIMPSAIFDIWPAEQTMVLLDDAARPALAHHVTAADRAKLRHWNVVDEFSKDDLIERLRDVHLPRPATWRQLLNLWTYIEPEITGYGCDEPKALRIIPVQGQDVLYAASEVVRLGEKKLLQSDDDWTFLAKHLVVLNQNWTRFLADQRRNKADQKDTRSDPVERSYEVLAEIELDETSDVSDVIEQVAQSYFRGSQVMLADCARIAQIAAKLGATIGPSFRYAAADRKLRSIGQTVLFDDDGSIEALLPQSLREKQLLHPDYTARFLSCSREEWLRWVSSGRSGLHTFIPLARTRTNTYGRARIEAEAKARGQSGSLSYPYVTNSFVIEDWNFSADYWKHWEELATSDEDVWAKVTAKIFAQRETYWSKTSEARLLQVATTGSTRSVSWETLRASWVLKLRDKPCLPDTRDVVHVPADLLRRTPETESFIDVEPFVHGLLDREATRSLLDMLGVRSAPSGPDHLLRRLRVLAGSDRAPSNEVEKWYRRLDSMLLSCSTADAQLIKAAFTNERLILAEDSSWVSASTVFLEADEEDVPGAAVIRSSVRDLALWHRIGVADRPSADLALAWLGKLPSGEALPADDARRVRTLLARYPSRIWEECGHWLNLLGEWVSVEMLAYGLSMQTLFRWSHLHDWVKRKTADFQRLSAEAVLAPPFSAVPPLSEDVEERFNQSSFPANPEDQRAWLVAFGTQLARIELADADETERVRTLGEAIAGTSWIAAQRLEVIPYLNGVPAGTARFADILWLDRKLFVSPLSKAKLAKRVPEEIGKNLSPDIRAALAYSFERSAEEIREYLEENFTLGPEKPMGGPNPVHSPNDRHADPVEEDAQKEDEEIETSGDVLTADDLTLSEDGEATAPLAEHDTGEAEGSDSGSESERRTRSPAKPPRPSVIARFALSEGFRPDGEDRFFHADGSWIGRANGARFPWDRRSATGEILRHYYPKEHCLELDPLQIEADVWGLLDQKPDLYSFILVNPEGEPVEMTGARLRELRDAGEITIHPATYRLVYDLDH